MTPDTGSDSTLRVTTSEQGPVVRQLEVEVDARHVRRAFDRAYRELARQARVRGFRPGKAPRSVLEKLYGASLTEQIEQTLVSETLPDAVEQAGLELITEPQIEAGTLAADGDFRYTARVEVKPEIALSETRGLPACRPAVQVTDEDVERELEALRQRSAPLIEEPADTAVAEGHSVQIDFVGRVDGKAFEGGSGRGVSLEIGSGRFIPGFEDQLVGAVAGEDRELRIRFPDDYGSREVAGKEAVFAVHVLEIKRRRVPDLDDEFAKDLGDFTTLEELRDRIRSDLTSARLAEAQSALRRGLMDVLIERTPFEVPPGLVAHELERQLTAARRRLQESVPEPTLQAQLERWKEDWRERAEREVREGLLLEAVAAAEAITVSDEDVEARIEEVARGQGTDAAALRRAMGEEQLRRVLRAQLLDERALDFLVREAKVEEKTDS
jgi:trigger factor